MKRSVDSYRFLGLSRGASREEMARRCETLLDWLDSEGLPQELRSWASTQQALVQDLYETLELDVDDEGGEVGEVSVSLKEGAEVGGKVRAFLSWWGRTPLALGLLGVLVGAALIAGVLWWRGVSFGGGEEGVLTANAQEALDPQQYLASQEGRIAELEQTVATNPHDVEALFELGETYMVGQSWEQAIRWFTKLLEIEPGNLHALTDVGTANMNLGRYSQAEAAFSQVLEAAPNDVQAHYNTGFLFAFRTDAPDLVKAVKHWQEVVRLAPGSSLAEIAQIHLNQFQPPGSSP